MICLILLLAYCNWQTTAIPVSAGPPKSVLSTTLVASICTQYVNFSETGKIEDPYRNGKQFPHKPMNTNNIKWTKCRTQDKKCTKFSQTKTDTSWFSSISDVVHKADNSGNNETGKSSRIYGGRNATKNEFPWLVNVVRGANCDHWCGGTILDEDTVLTAAHCVYFINDTFFMVIAGSHRSDRYEEDVEQAVLVKFVILNSDFDGVYGRDVALLKLNGVIKYTQTIHPILLTKYNPEEYPPQTPFMIAGWGYYDDNRIFSTFLQATEVKLMRRVDCEAIHRQYDYRHHSPSPPYEFCTGHTPGIGLCRGDSGGGLIHTIGGVPHLAGVIANSKICGVTPGVYMNVYILKGWIEANIKYDPTMN